MSSTPGQTFRQSLNENRTRTIDNDPDISTILGALEDEDCRAIIEATSEAARSTSELCDCCDLSSSTAYRKVDELTEAGLLEESIRLCPGGSHTSEYRLAVTDLEIDLGGGVLELSVNGGEDTRPMVPGE